MSVHIRYPRFIQTWPVLVLAALLASSSSFAQESTNSTESQASAVQSTVSYTHLTLPTTPYV